MKHAILIVVLLALAPWARAEVLTQEARLMTCGETKAMATVLQNTHHEVPVVFGFASHGDQLLFYICPFTRKWSIIIRRKNGTSCVILVGDRIEADVGTMLQIQREWSN